MEGKGKGKRKGNGKEKGEGEGERGRGRDLVYREAGSFLSFLRSNPDFEFDQLRNFIK
jgi:hypothetical protein